MGNHKKNPNAEISVYGQEKTAETVRLCKMNLAVHGLSGDIREGNSYYEDIHKSVGKFDFVMANSASDACGSEQDIRKSLIEKGAVDVAGLCRVAALSEIEARELEGRIAQNVEKLLGGGVMVACGFREKEPQINADERRFAKYELQLPSTVYSPIKLNNSPQSAQRTQSSELSATFALIPGKTQKPQRITRIGQIFTDSCASVSSCYPVKFEVPAHRAPAECKTDGME